MEHALRSPFPGMDPFLERHWEDVHTRLIGYIADDLAERLPDDLAARIEESVYIDTGEDERMLRRPDVRVVEDPVPWESRRAIGSAAAVADRPVILKMDRDPITQRSIRILDLNGNQVVTGIEVLSPWNKASQKGRADYLRKRDEFMSSKANLVEIDLVRAGDWVSLIAPFHVPPTYQSTYRVSVLRATQPDQAELYPIGLRQKLPTISVPLRPADADLSLELQRLLDRAYETGRYARTDYTRRLAPPLEGEDATWAEALLKAAGKL
jgi:hypothetical protein